MKVDLASVIILPSASHSRFARSSLRAPTRKLVPALGQAWPSLGLLFFSRRVQHVFEETFEPRAQANAPRRVARRLLTRDPPMALLADCQINSNLWFGIFSFRLDFSGSKF